MSWTCESCRQTFRDSQMPGITNSGAGKSQCMKCYNQGIPVDLSADNLCTFYKVQCNQSNASNKFGEECGSLNCPMG